jgi:hypothetical protein
VPDERWAAIFAAVARDIQGSRPPLRRRSLHRPRRLPIPAPRSHRPEPRPRPASSTNPVGPPAPAPTLRRRMSRVTVRYPITDPSSTKGSSRSRTLRRPMVRSIPSWRGRNRPSKRFHPVITLRCSSSSSRRYTCAAGSR